MLVMLAVGLVAGIADARPRFVCRDGDPDSATVRGMKTGGRSYPFCITDTVRDGACLFSFCTDLGYVMGCNLVPQCLGQVVHCTDPGWDGPEKGDRLTVPRGSSRVIERSISGGVPIGNPSAKTVRIKLLCR
ncbi:MAG: hypothetical protein U0807_10850 [Candidatus Binatia bacterium]